MLDSKSAVSFKIVNNTAAKGVISTSTSAGKEKAYEANGYLNGYMFDSDYEVVQGDIIVTSGMGSISRGYSYRRSRKSYR